MKTGIDGKRADTAAVGLAPGRLEGRLPDQKPPYSPAEALAEANRCLFCEDAPCTEACPSDIDVPTFIHKIRTGNTRGAARTIFAENLLGVSCARVCPVEVLCAGACVYQHWGRAPIQIGRLQRFATEAALDLDPSLIARTKRPSTGKKVALIGAGPASLAAAGHLALAGHRAVLFEQRQLPGGLNTTGVAPYKMHADAALDEVAFISGLGDIEVKTGIRVTKGDARTGSEMGADALLADYDAVFIGIGLGADSHLGIPAEEGDGVVGGTAFIERIKTDPAASVEGIDRAVVVGGGNTAIDIARELALLGVAEVTMIYRRDVAKMSGYSHEMEHARVEGVRLLDRRQPVEIHRDGPGKVTHVAVATTEDGRVTAGPVEEIPCDLVVMAIGQVRLTDLAAAFEGVALDEKGRVIVDEVTCRTGNAKVFAGGDCVNGGKEVVNAAQHGKLAARAIDEMLGA